ncbi:hypothetical protein RF55_6431 [Lasius niger]|uniref:Uncharacterized protein n=1 Tax=Lasius niger TaxID=67767 RepID=A0A0J7KT15_LASNI|nr:hypothetical protein RF55_6431 [Lasius niger]
MESYRERKSKEYGNKEKKRIFDELMFGYRSQNEVMKSLQIITVPKSIVVSVTTRAVGFMCQFLFCKFARLNVKFPLGNNGLPAVPNQSSPSRNKTGPSDVRTVFALHWKITFLAIRSDAGTLYIPRLPVAKIGNGNALEPTIVSFSTLRTIVSKLADVTTPRAERDYFYQHSASSGAIWSSARKLNDDGTFEDIPDTRPILQNPDDFMPRNYEINDLHRDTSAVEDLLEIIGRKYPKYVYALDFGSAGNVSQLVSNDVESIQCANLPCMTTSSK